MGALLTPPTTLTGEDYATVMVSLEFHQLIRRVSWSALDTYLESVGVVCSELLEWPVLISGFWLSVYVAAPRRLCHHGLAINPRFAASAPLHSLRAGLPPAPTSL